jgi:hypothetical protein
MLFRLPDGCCRNIARRHQGSAYPLCPMKGASIRPCAAFRGSWSTHSYTRLATAALRGLSAISHPSHADRELTAPRASSNPPPANTCAPASRGGSSLRALDPPAVSWTMCELQVAGKGFGVGITLQIMVTPAPQGTRKLGCAEGPPQSQRFPSSSGPARQRGRNRHGWVEGRSRDEDSTPISAAASPSAARAARGRCGPSRR